MLRTSSIHVFDHVDLYLTPVPLTFNLPKNDSNGTSPLQGQQLCPIVLKSMHYCTSYGPDKSGWTHGRKNIHQTKTVTTMSRLPASRLDKNDWIGTKISDRNRNPHLNKYKNENTLIWTGN